MLKITRVEPKVSQPATRKFILGVNDLLVKKEPRILGIDIENGTRWGWGPQGYTHSIVYCITSKWVGSPDEDVQTYWLDWRKSNDSLKKQLSSLWTDMEKADCFLGHNFRHDFKGLSGVAQDLLLPFPPDRKTIDTYADLPSFDGASKALENLCKQLGLGDKPHLSTYDWTEAFIRWVPDAISKVTNRNQQDVILTERLYFKEKELGWID